MASIEFDLSSSEDESGPTQRVESQLRSMIETLGELQGAQGAQGAKAAKGAKAAPNAQAPNGQAAQAAPGSQVLRGAIVT